MKSQVRRYRLTGIAVANGHRARLARQERGPASADHEERRLDLYGEGAIGHAEEESATALPPKGPLRDALAERVRELKEVHGATHLQAAVHLGLDSGQVSLLCRDYGIKSITKRHGSRGKGYQPIEGLEP